MKSTIIDSSVGELLASETPSTALTIGVIYFGTEGNDYWDYYEGNTPTYSTAATYLGTTMTGFGGNDVMKASHGDDALYGGTGNDYMSGGYGNDHIDGGDGIDTIDYSYYGKFLIRGGDYLRGAGVLIDLELGYAEGRLTTVPDHDSISNVENVNGSSLNDVIYGSAAANVLYGANGDDWLLGREGRDTLDGGNGDDHIYGGGGNDVILGGYGADVLDGGTDNDTVNYLYAAYGFNISLLQGNAVGTARDSDWLFGIENVVGTNFNDIIEGDGGANYLAGQSGNDLLLGGAGDDYLSGGLGTDNMVGGAGADHFDGGGGMDYVDYSESLVGVHVLLNGGTCSGGDAEGDVMLSVENVFGSNFSDFMDGNEANNQLFGGDGADFMLGEGGNDKLYGGKGGDILAGGDGNDLLAGDEGADVLDGGLGIDGVTFEDSHEGVNANLATGNGTGGDAEGDLYYDIENLLGSAWDDQLTGDDQNNFLSGYFGDDVLDGGAGHDRLDGFDGNDTLFGRSGNDFILGGWGDDRLNGGAGNDDLQGDRGADQLTGGGGQDRFTFVLAEDSNTSTGIDNITDFQQGQDLIDLGGLDANSSLPFDNAFTFIGDSGQPFNQGTLRFSHVNGTTVIEGDMNGQPGVDLTIILSGIVALTAADFVL